MKTINAKRDILGVLTFTLIGLMAVLAGCSNDSFSSAATAATGVVLPTGSPTPTTGCTTTSTASTAYLPYVTGGSTVTLNINSQEALDSYLGTATDAPTNIAININLEQTGQFDTGGSNINYGYGGIITIGYTDVITGEAIDYEDQFSSILQGGPNTITTQRQNDEYNLESTQFPGYPNGAFHGFYQGVTYCNGEPMAPGELCVGQIFGGAVIIVLNNTSGAVDSCGNPTASGSVWYKNFVGTGPEDGPLSGTSCWWLSAGPYQCREWLDGSGVNSLVNLFPNGTGGYQELGTFSGVNFSQAFNGTWQAL
jgi:hypothetical protein